MDKENCIELDGANSIGEALKTNKSLEYLSLNDKCIL